MERDLNQLMDREGGNQQGLSRAQSALQSGDQNRAMQMLEDMLSDNSDLRDLAGMESAQDALDRSQQALGEGGINPQEEMASGEQGQEGEGQENPNSGENSGGAPTPGSGEEGEESPGEGENVIGNRPGSEPAQDRPGDGDPGDLETASSESSKVKGQLDLEKGEIRRRFVRSLPLKTQSEVAEEDLLVDYQRRAEEVMVKEDIPLNFREYIRNYFLLIGVVE